MNPNKQNRSAPDFDGWEIDRLLMEYYGQLIEWGAFLAKGDPSKALDLVHDLYLHFKLTRPDLSQISNLDGYLYRSLRHIYLSNLARSSREALHFLSIADFDTARFALAGFETRNSLYRQNDLRKICGYAVWRKLQTKSASYFILRFFHGYDYQEVADLVRWSVAPIYSKISKFRLEAKTFLEQSGQLHIASRDLPPVPALRWTTVTSSDLFGELRKTILDARTGQCLPESELLKPYISKGSDPVPCWLLSHIVSCERCLSVIDRHLSRPTLDGRGPLDSIDNIPESTEGVVRKLSTHASRDRLLRSVQWFETEALQHRPPRLSIAVDGKIVASHAVASQTNTQSLILEDPGDAKFIEVFSNQGIRLAMTSIDELAPVGPHGRSQRVVLSSDRWLELNLSFVGLGLNVEVVYVDPAMANEQANEDDSSEYSRVSSPPESKGAFDGDSVSSPQPKTWLAFVRRFPHSLKVFPALNWSVAIACIICVAGYFVLRNQKKGEILNAAEVLNRSITAEAASLRGQTEHQVFRFEEISADGGVLTEGTIDLWRDGDGKRYIRRLYNSQHELIAAEGRQRDGSQDEYPKESDTQLSGTERELLVGALWKLDVASSAFRALSSKKTTVRSTADGYELSAAEPGASHAEIASATLVLDRQLHPVRETLRWRGEGNVREVRFIQADYERRPSTSVPDATFMVRKRSQHVQVQRGAVTNPVIANSAITDAQLTELHLAVLYQLSNLGADTREPIEVHETSRGRIRVAGSVGDEARKQEILTHLNQLENHEMLELEILSPQDAPQSSIDLPQDSITTIATYSAKDAGPPAEAALQAYFKAQGLSHRDLSTAVTTFSRDILKHSLRGLLEAGALNRLANDFSPGRLSSVSLAARQQWSEMVMRHASVLDFELKALQEQLTPLVLSADNSFHAFDESPIETPEQFAARTDELFAQTKGTYERLIDIFASNESANLPDANIHSSIFAAFNAVPLQNATRLATFAARLDASARIASTSQQQNQSDSQAPNRP